MKELEAELRGLRRIDSPPLMSTPLEDLSTIAIRNTSLPLAIKLSSMHDDWAGKMRVFAQAHAPGRGFELGYYVEDYQNMTLNDTTHVMQLMHERFVRSLSDMHAKELLGGDPLDGLYD